jgi:ATP-dependent DNA helicase PIF1
MHPIKKSKYFVTAEEKEMEDNTQSEVRDEPQMVIDDAPKEIRLSQEQQEVLDYALNTNDNMFITGAAGTGKTTLIKLIREELTKQGKKVAMTAMTGMAASHFNGQTIHYFAGIGKGEGSVADLAKKVLKRPRSMYHWLNTDVLVIDEISMMKAELLSALNVIAQECRSRKGVFFGGIRVILSGDFCQLPPIYSKEEPRTERYLFQSRLWNQVFNKDNMFSLVECHRQGKDLEYCQLLYQTRFAKQTEDEINTLLNTSIGKLDAKGYPKPLASGVLPTMILSTNAEVDAMNDRSLRALNQPIVTYKAVDWTINNNAESRIDSSCTFPATLDICVGAQVMLLKNIATTKGLVNGSRGVVETFGEYTDPEGETTNVPYVRFVSGNQLIPVPWMRIEGRTISLSPAVPSVVIWSRDMIPLKLAWAVTIHKSQGMTLDFVYIDMKKVFAAGQAYVALSRCTSLDGLIVVGLNGRCIKVDPLVEQFYDSLLALKKRKRAAA